MRKNTQAVMRAWRESKSARHGQSISTDGETIYSYSTAIVTRHNGKIIVNDTRYSVTTTQQQNSIKAELAMLGINFDTVTGIPHGARPSHLVRANSEVVFDGE